MSGSKGFLGIVAPTGWLDAIFRSLVAAVGTFFVLQIQEYMQVGSLDTPAAAMDALIIAGGVFVLNAILTAVRP